VADRVSWFVMTGVSISWLSISLSLPLVEVVASDLAAVLIRVGISWMTLVDIVTKGV